MLLETDLLDVDELMLDDFIDDDEESDCETDFDCCTLCSTIFSAFASIVPCSPLATTEATLC